MHGVGILVIGNLEIVEVDLYSLREPLVKHFGPSGLATLFSKRRAIGAITVISYIAYCLALLHYVRLQELVQVTVRGFTSEQVDALPRDLLDSHPPSEWTQPAY